MTFSKQPQVGVPLFSMLAAALWCFILSIEVSIKSV